jgi:hypothetical protein
MYFHMRAQCFTLGYAYDVGHSHNLILRMPHSLGVTLHFQSLRILFKGIAQC